MPPTEMRKTPKEVGQRGSPPNPVVMVPQEGQDGHPGLTQGCRQLVEPCPVRGRRTTEDQIPHNGQKVRGFRGDLLDELDPFLGIGLAPELHP